MNFGWFIATLLARILGPILVRFLDAQVAQFAKKNPTYGPAATEGLAALKELGLEVVTIVEGYKPPGNTTKEAWSAIKRDEGLRLLAAKTIEKGIAATENMLRRTIEESVTAMDEKAASP